MSERSKTKTKAKAKGKQPETKGQDGQLSCLNAAAKVLAEKGEPMNCKEMIEAMATKGYWTVGGDGFCLAAVQKSPKQASGRRIKVESVSSAQGNREIIGHGDDSKKFALRSGAQNEARPEGNENDYATPVLANLPRSDFLKRESFPLSRISRAMLE
jgi:hypothetical protein